MPPGDAHPPKLPYPPEFSSFVAPVHPPETNPQPASLAHGGESLPTPTLATNFRHSGWSRTRGLVYEALQRAQQSWSRKRAFAECGMFAFVYQSLDDPHRFRLGGSSCHDRYCVPCSRDRSQILAENVLKVLDGKGCRFLTLTLKHTAAPLRCQLDRLYSCFSRLRTRAAWSKHVRGGAAFLECKWVAKTETWHPHLHIILEGSYFPKELIKAEWYRVTGDSYVTDIRFVKDDAKVAGYVTKYVSKPFDSTFVNRAGLLQEHILAMHRRRLCLTFGTWRGIQLTETPDPGAWLSLGSLESLADSANAGDGVALEALSQLYGDEIGKVLTAAKIARPPPPEHDPKTHPIFRQLTFGWSERPLPY